jgi:ribosomal protein S18 acetylase RimI-like enzyme
VDGKPIAYARLNWDDELNGPRRYFSGGNILPEWRRKGIGTAMLAHNEARLREIAAGHPAELAKVVDMAMADNQKGAMALAEKHGFKQERYFFLMLRPLDAPIPEAVIPEGLELRPATDAQMRQIWEAENEAFRDHWGHVEGTEEIYQRWVSDPMQDPTLWKVAWDGDEVAGMVLNTLFKEENEKLGVKWGYTDPICVRRPWRRRGLARALILESLQMWKDMGFEHAALGVDTQNPSGALKLYEDAGYQVDERWIVYRKPME